MGLRDGTTEVDDMPVLEPFRDLTDKVAVRADSSGHHALRGYFSRFVTVER